MEPLFWYCNEVLLLTLNFKNHTHATNIEFALNTSSYIKNRLVGSYVHLANLFCQYGHSLQDFTKIRVTTYVGISSSKNGSTFLSLKSLLFGHTEFGRFYYELILKNFLDEW